MVLEAPEQGWRRPLAAAFGFGLIAVFVMAGALGLAVGVAFAALIALPPWRDLRALMPLDIAHSVFLMFIAWAWASMIWSPHGRTLLPVHMVLGAVLYPLFAYAIWTLRGRARRMAMLVALISGSLMVLPYLAEGSTGIYSHFIGSEAAREAMRRDATRGVSALVMALPALSVLWLQWVPGPKGRLIVAALVLATALVSWQFHLAAGLLALGIGAVFFALGWRWPRTTILIITLGYLAMLLLAPLLLPGLSAHMAEHSLPFSWAWRLEMWHYTGEQIARHPLFGWGLGASRSFAGDHLQMHGYTISYLLQHPHDLGLQVWLETGLVGVLLLALAIALFGMRLAGARTLSHAQGAAIAASAMVFFVFFSITYGAWQEWLWASVGWVAALCILTGKEAAPAP